MISEKCKSRDSKFRMIRHFIVFTVSLFLGASALSGQARESAPVNTGPSTTQSPSVVALVRDPSAVRRFEVDAPKLRAMTHRAVQMATGTRSPATAWRSLVRPTDRVGIKVSTAGGPFFSSHPALVAAVVEGLVSSGVSRQNIVVFDRSSQALREAGLTPERLGCRVAGFDPPQGFDPEGYFSFPFSGRLIWGDLLFTPASGLDPRYQFESDNISDRSHFPKVFNREIDRLISIPVLGTSALHGIQGSMINASVSMVDNDRRFGGRPHFGESSVPSLYGESPVYAKTIFHLVDGLVTQFNGGPRFDPKHCAQVGLLIAGRDPVAVDRISLEQIERLRKYRGLGELSSPAKYIEAAGESGLGESDLEKIRLNSWP